MLKLLKDFGNFLGTAFVFLCIMGGPICALIWIISIFFTDGK